MRELGLRAVIVVLVIGMGSAEAKPPCGHGHQPACPPPPTLSLDIAPSMESLPSDTPLGATVARATASWSDGSPFTGTLTLVNDDGGTFALDCNACSSAGIILSPAGSGLVGDAGTTQIATVMATQ